MLHHYHKGIRVVRVVHKAHKPSGVVVRVLVHLSRTAFGAQMQALVVIFAVLGFYIIAHQLLQLVLSNWVSFLVIFKFSALPAWEAREFTSLKDTALPSLAMAAI